MRNLFFPKVFNTTLKSLLLFHYIMAYDRLAYYLISKSWFRPSVFFHRIYIIHNYENVCVTKIKYIMHKVQD